MTYPSSGSATSHHSTPVPFSIFLLQSCSLTQLQPTNQSINQGNIRQKLSTQELQDQKHLLKVTDAGSFACGEGTFTIYFKMDPAIIIGFRTTRRQWSVYDLLCLFCFSSHSSVWGAESSVQMRMETFSGQQRGFPLSKRRYCVCSVCTAVCGRHQFECD